MKFVFFILLIIAAFVSQCRFTSTEGLEEGTESLPQDLERCNETPILQSACRASKRRAYYKAETNECIEFNYGGCGANGNIFNTKEECEKLCKK